VNRTVDELVAPFQFELPDELFAHEPPEARGISRDGVRLLVSHRQDDTVEHAHFCELARFLEPGDLLVVNTSATINAALPAWRARPRADERILVHLSTPLPDGHWLIELRRISGPAKTPLLDAKPGERLRLAGDGQVMLLAPFQPQSPTRVRLWIAELNIPGSVGEYTTRFGSPIRYGYVREPWPLDYYQTMFADEPGSAEMPSAGRAFTPGLTGRLQQRGVRIAPIVLHTGVGSLDAGERPYPERYRVPAATAQAVNNTRVANRRVIAVGTTVVRALETCVGTDERVHANTGWTDLHITPERAVRSVDALITGLHAPQASHLEMLMAIAGPEHLEVAYAAAMREQYLWHEFGDTHFLTD
jgi:S-adenosylmethionine:tRNA ribosyltransferase-isomerase